MIVLKFNNLTDIITEVKMKDLEIPSLRVEIESIFRAYSIKETGEEIIKRESYIIVNELIRMLGELMLVEYIEPVGQPVNESVVSDRKALIEFAEKRKQEIIDKIEKDGLKAKAGVWSDRK